jgi:type II secretory pathway pseudopilin PulG
VNAARHQHVPARPPLPPGEGRVKGAARRSAFSLVELLVVVSIMLMLMGLIGAAVSAARTSQKKQATQSLIAKLDALIQQQYSTYASRSVPAIFVTGTTRAAYLRQMISGDMPDRWTDVAYMASGTMGFPQTAQQRAYVGIWKSMPSNPSNDYAGAECLFMIVMRGGVANCIDCGELRTAERGDKDSDGAQEFWDAWGNPIGFILWPGGLKLPSGTVPAFFSTSPPFMTGATGRIMRPLIYSAGPDGVVGPAAVPGECGFARSSEVGNLAQGLKCGDPSQTPTSDFAAPLAGATDNITNLDAEALK